MLLGLVQPARNAGRDLEHLVIQKQLGRESLHWSAFAVAGGGAEASSPDALPVAIIPAPASPASFKNSLRRLPWE